MSFLASLARLSRKKLLEERGGATVEFVTLALPLFIPLFIFIGQYSIQSDLEGNLRTLSREMARGIVTSENDSIAEDVAYEIFIKGGEVLGYGDQISSGSIKFRVLCRENPCISPNNEVTVTISSSELKNRVSAVEFVSPWA